MEKSTPQFPSVTISLKRHALSADAKSKLLTLLGLSSDKPKDRENIGLVLSQVGYALGSYPKFVRYLDHAPRPADYRSAFRAIYLESDKLLQSLLELRWGKLIGADQQPVLIPTDADSAWRIAAEVLKKKEEARKKLGEALKKPGNARGTRQSKRHWKVEFNKILEEGIQRVSEGMDLDKVELALGALVQASAAIVQDFAVPAKENKGRPTEDGLRAVARDLRTIFRKFYREDSALRTKRGRVNLRSQLEKDEKQFVLIALQDAAIYEPPKLENQLESKAKWISRLLRHPRSQPDVAIQTKNHGKTKRTLHKR